MKKARAILDQIIWQLLCTQCVSVGTGEVRICAQEASAKRMNMNIYYLMWLQTQCGDGSRAKGKICCLIWNQWHPFSFFDMDRWNDASHKWISICTLYKYSLPHAKSGQFWFIYKTWHPFYHVIYMKISIWISFSIVMNKYSQHFEKRHARFHDQFLFRKSSHRIKVLLDDSIQFFSD